MANELLLTKINDEFLKLKSAVNSRFDPATNVCCLALLVTVYTTDRGGEKVLSDANVVYAPDLGTVAYDRVSHAQKKYNNTTDWHFNPTVVNFVTCGTPSLLALEPRLLVLPRSAGIDYRGDVLEQVRCDPCTAGAVWTLPKSIFDTLVAPTTRTVLENCRLRASDGTVVTFTDYGKIGVSNSELAYQNWVDRVQALVTELSRSRGSYAAVLAGWTELSLLGPPPA